LLDSLLILYKNFNFFQQVESTHVSSKQLGLLLKLVEWWMRVTGRSHSGIPCWICLIRTNIL